MDRSQNDSSEFLAFTQALTFRAQEHDDALGLLRMARQPRTETVKYEDNLDLFRRVEIQYPEEAKTLNEISEMSFEVGALRQLDSTHAELKSMHTAKSTRGAGVGRSMVAHILDFAKGQGTTRVSLEKGNFAAFQPARNLYARFGFVVCDVFGDYSPSPISVCMTKYI